MTRRQISPVLNLNIFILFPIFSSVCTDREVELPLKVFIDVYYSLRDMPSAEFFEFQLKPLVQSPLANYIDITLNPFVGCERKKGEIICKAGKDVMYANLHLTCAFYHLYHLKPRSNGEPFNVNAVMYVICVLGKMNFRGAQGRNCTNYVRGILESIRSCMRSEGEDIKEEFFAKAQQIKSKDYPVIVLNDKIIPRSDSWSSMIKEICKRFKMDKPEVCGGFYLTTHNFLYIFTFLICVLFK